MRTLRRVSLFGAGIAAVGLALVATAWACTGTGSLNPDELPNGTYPASGEPGRTVTVTGQGYDVGGSKVEIRWDDSATPLAYATPANARPQFAVAVTIPADASAGVHYLVATQPGNTRIEPGRMAFEVVPAAQPSSGGATGATTAPGVASGSASGAGLAGAAQPAPAPAAPSASPAPALVAEEDEQASAAAPAAAAAATRAVSPVGAVAASGNPPAVATPAGDVVFGGSLPAPAASTASPRSVTGDLYSGFDAERTARAVGLTDAPASAGPLGQAVLGMVLLVAGLLALSGGFLVAEVRRRRSLAVATIR